MATNIVDRLNKVLNTLNSNNIAKEAYTKFVDVTPIKSGNAKRSTKLQGNTIRYFI